MNKEDKRWRPTTMNNDNGNNQQWRQTMIKMRNAIGLYWKPLLKFLCMWYEFLHAFFCPAISKVPTPNHDVRRSLVTAKDYITPDWCHHTLQASSAHAWEQYPHFLQTIHIYFWSCITDKITWKIVHFVRHYLCSCGSPECPLRLGIMSQYLRDIFQTCMWTICILKRFHMRVLWILQIWLK